jgi:hypothetical protein
MGFAALNPSYELGVIDAHPSLVIQVSGIKPPRPWHGMIAPIAPAGRDLFSTL